jgi:hypothetical protein
MTKPKTRKVERLIHERKVMMVKAWAFAIRYPDGLIIARAETSSRKNAAAWRSKFDGPGYSLGKIVAIDLPAPRVTGRGKK